LNTPLPAPEQKAAAVRGMFGAIAPRYDLLNRVLSLNRDSYWRRAAAKQLLQAVGTVQWRGEDRRSGGRLFLDACAGTLELARELTIRGGSGVRVIASDFAFPMLERGRTRTRGLAVARVCADTLLLPFASGLFDGAVVGFGIRNLAAVDAGLNELARVLRPAAPLVVLEFATPAWPPFRALYLFYFRRLLPWIGRLLTRHDTAYSYLPASVLAFASPAQLSQQIERAGFEGARWQPLTGGIVALHVAVRSATEAVSAERLRPVVHPRQ
jgi:demethylmenaquinone methyltransferase/2-methoxy-6-polyprenyl-1,4-benzoquinol methylase